MRARILFFVLAASSAAAQAPARPAPASPATKFMASVDTALFSGLKYRMVGPPRGGRVTTVTGVPSQPRTFYMGVASGGLFRTTDGGATWVPITDGKVPVASTGSVAVAESDPEHHLSRHGLGRHAQQRLDRPRRLQDPPTAATTWTFAGLYNAGQIGAVRIHPTNPNIVWVAANGDMFKPNHERGVFKTTDGGKTWQQGAVHLATAPARWTSRSARRIRTSSTRGCGADRAQAVDDHQRARREGGFYKSTDGGEHLDEDHERPADRTRSARAISRSRRRTRIASTPWSKRSRAAGSIARTTQGESWKLVNSHAGA